MATISELRQQAKAHYQAGKGDRRFKGYSRMNKAGLEALLGQGAQQPQKPAPKSSTGKKFETSKTSGAVAAAIAKKTGGNAKEIHESLKKKLQAAITKKRAQLKKEGREATPKDLRAAAVLAIKQSAREALKGKVASEEKSKRTGVKTTQKPNESATKTKAAKAKADAGKTLDDLNNQPKTSDTYAPPGLLEAQKNLKKLGQGNYADVFIDHSKDPPVVIKYGSISDNEAHFQNIAASIGVSPKIVTQPTSIKDAKDLDEDYKDKIDDQGQTPRVFAMELANGGTLKTDEDRLRAVHALIQLNRSGIAHNDFHDENAIVDSSGAAKIIDFGRASRSWRDIAANDISFNIVHDALNETHPELEKERKAFRVKIMEVGKKFPGAKAEKPLKPIILSYFDKLESHLKKYGIS